MSLNSNTVQHLEGVPGAFPTLWSYFRDATGDDYFHYWLALQSSLISNTVQGILVSSSSDSDTYEPVAKWPEGPCDLARLTEICESSLEQRCGLLSELPSPDGSASARRYAISYPILVDNALQGVVAMEVAALCEAELAGCMEQLQWGVCWLELYFLRLRCAEQADLQSVMKSSFDLLAAVVAEEHFTSASMVFATGLATLLKCDRVSLGFLRKNHVVVQAMSHSANFGRQMNLVRFISAAMEEAVLQRSELVFPLPDGAKVLVTRDHEALSRQQGGESVLSIPLHVHNRCYGAVTLERHCDLPFQQAEVKTCRGIVGLVAPILEARRQNDRLALLVVADSLRRQLARLLGAGYPGRKLAAVVLIAATVFLAQATGPYRVTAPTTLEPSLRRSVVSPFNGYVKEAAVRSGDVVSKGAVLCSLDGKDLHLERGKWLNQQTQYQRQRQEAIASNDRARANIIAAQLDQAKAQLALVQNQLSRTALVAPFDGVVVSGDLSQRIDGAVEQGEVLFELAPLNSYRVILQVDEYRIAEVHPGQRGILVLPAVTDANFDFVVEKITPISTQKEGKNYFRVEAKLGKASELLRPGMEGIGKIYVDRRRLVSIWTRDLRDWMRIKAWSWWP